MGLATADGASDVDSTGVAAPSITPSKVRHRSATRDEMPSPVCCQYCLMTGKLSAATKQMWISIARWSAWEEGSSELEGVADLMVHFARREGTEGERERRKASQPWAVAREGRRRHCSPGWPNLVQAS